MARHRKRTPRGVPTASSAEAARRPGDPRGRGGRPGRTDGGDGLRIGGGVWLLLIVAVAGVGLVLAGLSLRSGTPGPSPSTGAQRTIAPSQGPSASGSPADGFGPSSSAVSLGDCPAQAPEPAPATEKATVSIQTPKGTIAIEVSGALGPRAAANFLALADCGYFDGVVFHRLSPGFVIQGGDGQFGRLASLDRGSVGKGGPGYQFADDPVTVPYKRGTVAMANSGANTNGSQFFICLADLPSLPPSYSVFGTVTSGMDVVDAIAAMPNEGGQAQLAVDPVPMERVTVQR